MAKTKQEKKEFNLDLALNLIEKSILKYQKAAMFELYEKGFKTVFEQLLGCIISIRTRDEVTLKVSENLFKYIRKPENVLNFTYEQIDSLIKESTFHQQKAYRIIEIAKISIEKYNGDIPCSHEILLSLPGVGPKCANLVLGVSCNQPFISVDIHVHRVTNRWGYINEKTPELSLKSLEEKIPKNLWIDINRLLMPFGKHICTGVMPKCSTCPVLDMCSQVGVTEYI